MSTQASEMSTRTPRANEPGYTRAPAMRRNWTETKSFIKTSEFWVFAIATAAVLIVTYARDNDSLNAYRGWTLATVLCVAYMVTRGFAKAGSREPYTEQRD